MKGNYDKKNNIITNSKHRWTDNEEKQLISNIKKYGLNNENRIVENLNRTSEACRMRWYTKINKNIENKIQIMKRIKKQDDKYYNCLAPSWSKDEENKLIQAIELYGTSDWNIISQYINTDRSASGCYNKWGKLKYRVNNDNHIQTRNLNRNKNKRSNNVYNQHKIIDLSNMTIAFADNSSPATTPTATTRSSYSLETNQRSNSENIIMLKNNSNQSSENINSNNYSSTNVIPKSEKDDEDSITTIYDFLYRMEKITSEKWGMNDVNQLMIIMSKHKTSDENWIDIGEKMIKKCDDCKKVWGLVKKLSPNVVGDIMVSFWRNIN